MSFGAERIHTAEPLRGPRPPRPTNGRRSHAADSRREGSEEDAGLSGQTGRQEPRGEPPWPSPFRGGVVPPRFIEDPTPADIMAGHFRWLSRRDLTLSRFSLPFPSPWSAAFRNHFAAAASSSG